MKSEVSCRALEIFFKEFSRRKLSHDELIRGVPYTGDYLKNKRERITWDAYTKIAANFSKHANESDCVDLGHLISRTSAFRPFAAIARLIANPLQIYEKIASSDSIGKNLFNCVTTNFSKTSQTDIQIELIVSKGYENCPVFLWITRGVFESIPGLLGLPFAKVEMTTVPTGAIYQIDIPKGGALIQRALAKLRKPAAVVTAHRALKEAHDEVVERYHDLDDAKAQLFHQKSQLEISNEIGIIALQNLDIDNLLSSISKILVAKSEVEGARISFSATLASKSQDWSNSAGILRQGTHVATKMSTETIKDGKIESWTHSSPEETTKLLSFVAPTIALAVENALAFQSIHTYQNNLEALVEDRTNDLQVAKDKLGKTVVHLREAQAVKERFFANINHEIRTPLSLIVLAGEELDRKLAENNAEIHDVIGENMQSIKAGTKDLVELVNDLLSLAEGKEGVLTVSPKPTPPEFLLEQLRHYWSPFATTVGVSINFENAVPQSALPYLDPAAFQKIANNLISNAIKFTPAKGKVSVQLNSNPKGTEFIVSDTGIGIAPELQSKIFQRFEGGGKSLHAALGRGTGIGLSLVRDLVDLHFGFIQMSSVQSEGSTFKVFFPKRESRERVHRETSSLLASEAAPTHAATHFLGGHERTVLLAEDNPKLLKSLATILSKSWNVLCATDGAEALELARAHHPDILVTDVDLPSLSGLVLAQKFRKSVGGRLAPVIIVSAAAAVDDRILGLEKGASDYLVKPFSAYELLSRMETQMRLFTLAKDFNEREKASAIGILSAGLAHNLRNPANALVHAIPLLRRQLRQLEEDSSRTWSENDKSDLEPLLEAVEQSASRVAQLAEDLGGLGTHRNDPVNVSATDLVKDALHAVRPSFPNVSFDAEFLSACPVRCVKMLVVHALAHVIDNAAQATTDGCVKVHVSTAFSDADEKTATFRVRNTGPQIPRGVKEKMFDAFFSTRAPGAGTGLGLSLAQASVRHHQGSLKYLYKDGENVFEVKLPCEPVPEEFSPELAKS